MSDFDPKSIDLDKADWDAVQKGMQPIRLRPIPPAPPPLSPEFKEAVSELLFQAQMIEQMLKVVLHDVAEIIEFAVKGQIRFRYDIRKDKRTLGQLVKAYEVHAIDEELVRRLTAFVKYRNHAAHVAFVWGYAFAADEELIKKTLREIREHIATAKTLLDDVTKESIRLRIICETYEKARKLPDQIDS